MDAMGFGYTGEWPSCPRISTEPTWKAAPCVSGLLNNAPLRRDPQDASCVRGTLRDPFKIYSFHVNPCVRGYRQKAIETCKSVFSNQYIATTLTQSEYGATWGHQSKSFFRLTPIANRLGTIFNSLPGHHISKDLHGPLCKTLPTLNPHSPNTFTKPPIRRDFSATNSGSHRRWPSAPPGSNRCSRPLWSMAHGRRLES